MEATKRPTVLIISPHPNALGGVVSFIETLKKNLIKYDVNSFYVGSQTEEKELLRIKILRTLKTLCHFISFISKNRFDVVHINPSFTTHSILRDGLILGVLRLKGYKKTLIYFHGWNKNLVNRVQDRFFLRAVFSWVMKPVRFSLVLSPNFRQSLMALGIKEDRIIYTRTMFDGSEFANNNVADTQRGYSGGIFNDDPAQRGGAVAGARRPPKNQNILFMARFDARKGMYELLEAFSKIAQNFPDTTLTFAGDGAEDSRLREKVKTSELAHRINFTGYVSGLEKIKLLHDCTLFVLPSSTAEGMPVALLEAMAAGKPVIVSDAGGIPFIIHEPRNGVVLNMISPDTIANALQQLLTDETYCANVGMHNKEYAWKNFEAKTVTAEIEKLYDIIAHS